MTLKEKALNLIGLAVVTNRDQLIDELAAMDGESLYMALADNRLTRRIDDLWCEDCKRMHGGTCPCPEDGKDCPLSEAEWMELPCERERLLERLPEVAL